MKTVVGNMDKNVWRSFIEKFPNRNIFHSPEMAKVFQESDGFETYPIFVIENKMVYAFALAVLVKIDSIFPQKFTNRLIMYASPLYDNSEKGEIALKLLLKKAYEIAIKNSLFLEIRNSELFPADHDQRILSDAKYIPYQNYFIDLSKGSDSIWSNLNSYTRNHCRKYIKKGAVIREIRNDELENAVQLMENLYKEKKVPFLNRSIFFKAFEKLKKDMIRFMVLEYTSKIIATRISLNYGNTVLDWYAAADSKYKDFYPNDALVWDTLKWGCDNDYSLFDFGGGAIKGQYYGPAKFKEKYRGKLVEYGRYRFPSNKLVYYLANKGYNLIMRLH